MEKKIFAFDIDGTLFDHKNYEVPQSALDTLRHLRSEGHIVGVATGRNQSQLEKAIDPKEFDFCIICNGGYLEIDGKKVSDIQFSQDQKNLLCDLFDGLGYEYGITTHHHLYANNPDSEGVQRIIQAYRVITPEKYSNLRELPIYQFTVYEAEETRKNIPVVDKEFHVHSLGGFGYDIVIPEINKAVMLKQVARLYGFGIEDTIVFGDADNDIMFLKEAGIGVAMGNGTQKAKKSADMITAESYNDGIYKGVKHLGYID